MDKKALLEQFDKWYEDEEHEKIIAAVLALPEKALDSEIMSRLAKAYLDTGEYRQAIAVLEGLREKDEDTFMWQFQMGLVLLETAENDEECQEDEVLKKNILTRSRICFARGMNMSPPGVFLDAMDLFIEKINDLLGEKEEDEFDPEELEMYEEEEIDAIEDHIKEYFGEFPTVLHETVSEDIHVDVCVIPPTKERNYFTMVTMGMGAHAMNIPEGLGKDKERAELVICLPPDWKVGEDSEKWFWPVGVIKSLTHLPINCDTWLGWGHTIDNQSPYYDETELCGSLLVFPEGVEEGAEKCELPNGNIVNFFQVIPLYREEMHFKIDNDTTELLQKLQNVAGHIVDPNRPNSCEDYFGEEVRFDSAKNHMWKIREKNLPLDIINGCNHIAIFMRWCVENGLMAKEFHTHCKDVEKAVLDKTDTDMREFIMDYFDGRLELYQFSFVGANFLSWYYSGREDDKYYYCADVDTYAEKYFGTEKYNSEEFQDEAYLFVPFDEKYYKGMSKYIKRAYKKFIDGFVRDQVEHDMRMSVYLSHRLGITCDPVSPDGEQIKEFADKTSHSYGRKSDILLVLNDHSLCENAEDTINSIRHSTVPFLNSLTITTLPFKVPENWIKKHFTKTDEFEGCENAYADTKETFGCLPWILSFDSPDEELALIIPGENGTAIRYIYNGDEE